MFAAKTAEAQSTATDGDRQTSPGLLPHPSPRVVVGSDPETLANRAGTFTVAPVVPPEAAAFAASPPIRKVGSDFYYAAQIVIETLRDPPPRGPEFTLIGSAEAHPRRDFAP